MHLSEEAQRAEYVVSDSGLLFDGTYHQPRHFAWLYGQYESDVLEVALLLISRSISSPSGTVVFDGLYQRANPVLVVRAISAMVSRSLFCDAFTNSPILLNGRGRGQNPR